MTQNRGYSKNYKPYRLGSYIKKGDRESLIAIGKCMYCGNTELLEIDHITALKNGGTSQRENLTVACSKCNSMKGDFPLDVFLARIILKRDKVFNTVFKYTGTLLRHRRRGGHLDIQEWCAAKIKESRLLHSYYTRIVHSILTEKYIVNAQNQNS
jgi:hypothetical protein